MISDVELDSAATAGYESFRTGASMPPWVLRDDLLISAWRCGCRQAADKAAA